ncbi:MAG: hypothetical protein JW923_07110 [Spirochaetales bacterium]|nr:hypothetical protein [Spirochaetales bacterium]
MKKIVCIGLLFALFCAMPAMAQSAIPKAKTNDVIFVYKLQVLPAIPTEFYLNYADYRKTPPPTVTQINLWPINNFIAVPVVGDGKLNTFNYVRCSRDKKNEYQFHNLVVRVANMSATSLKFDVGLQANVPEGVQYVYLGTFIFRYSDEFFTPESFERLDEFDLVVEELQAAFGPDVNVARAKLIEPEED